jgi:hypothetical protein
MRSIRLNKPLLNLVVARIKSVFDQHPSELAVCREGLVVLNSTMVARVYRSNSRVSIDVADALETLHLGRLIVIGEPGAGYLVLCPTEFQCGPNDQLPEFVADWRDYSIDQLTVKILPRGARILPMS